MSKNTDFIDFFTLSGYFGDFHQFSSLLVETPFKTKKSTVFEISD